MRTGSGKVAQHTPAGKRDAASDSTVVHNFIGYATVWWAMGIYQILVLLTGGVAWVLRQCSVHGTLWRLQKCPLSRAEFVLVQFINGREELVKVRKISLHASSKSRSSFQQGTDDKSNAPTVRLITLLLVVYIYDEADDTFKQLPGMPAHIPLQIHNAKRVLELVDQGAEWTVFNSVPSWQRRDVQLLYGDNDVSTERPSLLKMSGAILLFPPFVVQYCEFVHLYYLHYYQLASTLLFMTLSSAFLSSIDLCKKRKELFKSIDKQRLTPLVHNGRVRAISSRRLVPGDVTVMLPGTASCDMVLLRGHCLVEDSNLTGEAAQVRKSSFVARHNAARHAYHPDTHHSCTVFAGTVIQQVWANGDTDDEVLGMVVRNGFRTTMGDMLRQIVAPVHHMRWTKDPFLADLWRFYGFAFLIQCILFLTAAVPFLKTHPVPLHTILPVVISLFIAAAPIAVPTVIICSNGACAVKLKKQGIQVLNPGKLKVAADVGVVCFDKTGTLTGSAPELHGMLPVEDGRFTGLQQSATRWPEPLKTAVAVCNSLTLVSKTQVVGDLADKQAFTAIEARFLERDVVLLPLRNSFTPREAAAVTSYQVLKRFDFEPRLMRSGVIAVQHNGTAFLYVKGAPSMIKPLLREESLPPGFQKVLMEYAGRSFRVMALAGGMLRHVTHAELATLDQEQAEACCGPMTLLGLLVLSNHLRPTSKDTIANLQNRGGIRCLMVTGDYQHTAIAVAKGVGMVRPDAPLVIIQSKAELDDTAESSTYSHPTSDASYSFRHTSYPVLGGSRNPSKPSSRDPSFTGTLGSRDPSFTGRPGSRDPSLTSRASCRDAVSLLQSITARTISQSSLPPAGRNGMWTPSFRGRLSRVHPTVPSVTPSLTLLNGNVATTASTGAAAPPWAAAASVGTAPPASSAPTAPAGANASSANAPSAATSPRAVELAALLNTAASSVSDGTSPGHGLSSSPQQSSAGNATLGVRAPVSILRQSMQACGVEQASVQELQSQSCEGLVFMLQSEDCIEEVSAHHALTSIAQGSVQCCVTGCAFQQMLQQADASVVHTVMGSVAVFARMRGQQKGQVMDLLGRRGLYHMHAGEQHHLPGLGAVCMYCGDGINDLVALAAADVGMAVGSSNASAAACISDQHASVEGVVSVLLETRSAQVIKLSAIKYMVAYELLVAVAVSTVFKFDGSHFSIVQRSTIDFVAISLGMLLSVRQAAPQLTFNRPPQRLCTIRNLVMLLVSVVVTSMMYLVQESHLRRQSFYKDASLASLSSPNLTLVWVAAMSGTLLPLISFTADTEAFCKKLSKPEAALMTTYTAFCIACFIAGPDWFDVLGIFHFYPMPFYFMWRAYLLALGCSLCYLFIFRWIRIVWDRYS